MIRLIDCAPRYENQESIGQAINEAINTEKVKRHELFIISKLYHTCRVISKSVLWTELPGPSESVRENFTRYCSQRQKVRKKFSACFSLLSMGRVFYRWPIYDNGTSNVHKSPSTTDLITLGHIFGIRRQNSIRITL